MRLTALVSTLATLSLLCVPLAAEEHDGEGHCREKGERHAKLLERFDANKDGVLDEGERAAVKQAHKEHGAERAAEILAKHPELDTDGDGKLSREEGEAGRAKHQAKRQAELKEKHPEAFAKVDTNGDGTIDQGERCAAEKRHLEKHPEADRNGDGELNRCERKQDRQEHKEKCKERKERTKNVD